MEEKILVLHQFAIEGEIYTSYMQEHTSDISQIYAILPNLYCVVFCKNLNSLITPVGGLIIKSNIAKDDKQFDKKIQNLAITLEPASSLFKKANTLQIVKVNQVGSELLTEIDCKRIATHTYTMVGVSGNA